MARLKAHTMETAQWNRTTQITPVKHKQVPCKGSDVEKDLD